MIPLQTHIHCLRESLGTLEWEQSQINRDFMAGRVDVLVAKSSCEAAQVALDAGDESRAALLMVEALAAWSRALNIQLPAKHRTRLQTRPDTGGRPSREWLARRLRAMADEQPTGTIIARCRAAIAADPLLQSAYGTLSDGQVRRAYSNK